MEGTGLKVDLSRTFSLSLALPNRNILIKLHHVLLRFCIQDSLQTWYNLIIHLVASHHVYIRFLQQHLQQNFTVTLGLVVEFISLSLSFSLSRYSSAGQLRS